MRAKLFIAAIATIILSLTKPATAETWKCSAPGMVSGSYDGGGSAYIHLSAFKNGGTYSVTKKGKVATGTTANGTKFTCRMTG